MRPSAFLIAICAIVISANASSTEKRQLRSPPNPCEDTLRQGLANSKQAVKTLRKASLESYSSADLVYKQLKTMIDNLQLTSKYCCKSSGVNIPSKDSEGISTIFTEYFQILPHIRSRNKNFYQGDATKKYTNSLYNDCASHIKVDPRHRYIPVTN